MGGRWEGWVPTRKLRTGADRGRADRDKLANVNDHNLHA